MHVTSVQWWEGTLVRGTWELCTIVIIIPYLKLMENKKLIIHTHPSRAQARVPERSLQTHQANTWSNKDSEWHFRGQNSDLKG